MSLFDQFKRLKQATEGASAVEFSLVALPLFAVMFGTVEYGRATWVRHALEETAIATARCMGVLQSECSGDDGQYDAARTIDFVIQTAGEWSVSLDSDDFTLVRDAECAGVSGFSSIAITYDFETAVPGLIDAMSEGLPIATDACFPNQTASLDGIDISEGPEADEDEGEGDEEEEDRRNNDDDDDDPLPGPAPEDEEEEAAAEEDELAEACAEAVRNASGDDDDYGWRDLIGDIIDWIFGRGGSNDDDVAEQCEDAAEQVACEEDDNGDWWDRWASARPEEDYQAYVQPALFGFFGGNDDDDEENCADPDDESCREASSRYGDRMVVAADRRLSRGDAVYVRWGRDDDDDRGRNDDDDCRDDDRNANCGRHGPDHDHCDNRHSNSSYRMDDDCVMSLGQAGYVIDPDLFYRLDGNGRSRADNCLDGGQEV